MSFINSIIKVFVGDKSQKMSKFTTVLNKIKTLKLLMALSHDELRGRTAFLRIE
jgi:preprotein translocase subunit SecA